MVIFLGTPHIAQVTIDLQKADTPRHSLPSGLQGNWPEQKIVKGTLSNIVQKVKAEGITETA
jgi:precorrin-4 methylase